MTLQGAACLVTGAAGGLGLALAQVLAGRGARVALFDIRGELLREEARGIPGSLAIAGDITADGDLDRAVETVAGRFGGLDVLVNNAGVGVIGTLPSLPMEVVEQAFRINVLGAVRGIQAAVPVMRRQGSGLIVTISSGRSASPSPDSPVYAATKAALNVLGAGLRKEVAGEGIRVMTVFPGPLDNEFNAHSLFASEAERERRLGAGATPTNRTPFQAAREIVDAIEAGHDHFPPDATPRMPW